MKKYKFTVTLKGGNYIYFLVNEDLFKKTQQDLAEGIVRNGIIEKDPSTGKYKVEGYEVFAEGMRISFFWLHDVSGFFVETIFCEHSEAEDFNKKMADVQLNLLTVQLEFFSIMLEKLKNDDGEAWKKPGFPDGI